MSLKKMLPSTVGDVQAAWERGRPMQKVYEVRSALGKLTGSLGLNEVAKIPIGALSDEKIEEFREHLKGLLKPDTAIENAARVRRFREDLVAMGILDDLAEVDKRLSPAWEAWLAEVSKMPHMTECNLRFLKLLGRFATSKSLGPREPRLAEMQDELWAFIEHNPRGFMFTSEVWSAIRSALSKVMRHDPTMPDVRPRSRKRPTVQLRFGELTPALQSDVQDFITRATTPGLMSWTMEQLRGVRRKRAYIKPGTCARYVDVLLQLAFYVREVLKKPLEGLTLKDLFARWTVPFINWNLERLGIARPEAKVGDIRISSKSPTYTVKGLLVRCHTIMKYYLGFAPEATDPLLLLARTWRPSRVRDKRKKMVPLLRVLNVADHLRQSWIRRLKRVLGDAKIRIRPDSAWILTPESARRVHELGGRFPGRLKRVLIRVVEELFVRCLCVRPLRETCYAEMKLGRNLFKDKKKAKWYIEFDPNEVKELQMAYEFWRGSLPESVVPLMEFYLDVVRPVMLDFGRSDYVFVNSLGKKWTGMLFSQMFRKWTERVLAVPVNVHLMRDIALDYVMTRIGDIRVAAALLGNTIQTCLRNYMEVDIEQGLQRFDSAFSEDTGIPSSDLAEQAVSRAESVIARLLKASDAQRTVAVERLAGPFKALVAQWDLLNAGAVASRRRGRE